MYRTLSASTLLLCTFCLFSCYYDIEEELYPTVSCDTTSMASFANTVTPILQQHCTSCHGGNSPTAGIGLTDYTGVRNIVDDGRLECSIWHLSGCSPMPDDLPQIPICQREEISKWIDQGANDD